MSLELILALVLGSILVVRTVVMRPQSAQGTGFSQRMQLPPAFSAPALELLKLFPAYTIKLQEKLNHAGYRGNVAIATLSAAKVYPVLLAPLLWLFVNQPLFILPVALILFFVPDLFLHFAVSKRQQSIREALPELLDLMVLCVDAGLGLDATISRVATDSSRRSALIDEVMTLSRDILLGMDRQKAFAELYKRTGVEELRSFAASLNQSNQLGISVSRTLRNQAEFLRGKLTQKAEEKAARLPIYMAFPLWFCIMPALMVLVLAPSLIIFFREVKPSGLGF